MYSLKIEIRLRVKSLKGFVLQNIISTKDFLSKHRMKLQEKLEVEIYQKMHMQQEVDSTNGSMAD